MEIYHTETQEDYNALMDELEKMLYSNIEFDKAHNPEIEIIKYKAKNTQLLSSFEDCNVNVLVVYSDTKSSIKAKAYYESVQIKFIDNFVIINDKTIINKNDILKIEKNYV